MQRSDREILSHTDSDVRECDYPLPEYVMADGGIAMGSGIDPGIDGVWRVIGDDGWCGVCIGPGMAGE